MGFASPVPVPILQMRLPQPGHKARAVSLVRLHYRILLVDPPTQGRWLICSDRLFRCCVGIGFRRHWLDDIEQFSCIWLFL